MNIAVISPHTHRAGTTSIASLIALELSTRGKTVCLTHTSSKAKAMTEYFQFKTLGEDKTANPSKLAGMLRVGAVKPEEIPDYCKPISLNIDAFTNSEGKISEDDVNFILEYMLDKFPQDFKVYDIDNDYTTPITKLILQKSDLIIFVITQGILELYDFKAKIRDFATLLKYKPALLVVNKFDSKVCSMSDVEHVLKANVSKKAPWFKVGYSPLLIKYENYGKLLDYYNAMRNGDLVLAGISKNIKDIANQITKTNTRGKQIKAAEQAKRDEAINNTVNSAGHTQDEEDEEAEDE